MAARSTSIAKPQVRWVDEMSFPGFLDTQLTPDTLPDSDASVDSHPH